MDSYRFTDIALHRARRLCGITFALVLWGALGMPAQARDALQRAVPAPALAHAAKAPLPAFQSHAGMIGIGANPERPEAEIFHVAYTQKGANPATRPVTFVFNGGPGGASIYLHLAALGPKTLVTPGDGTFPKSPARLEDNPQTWLDFTDLVFIDPVGTGYSRTLPNPDGTLRDPKPYYSVTGDVESFAQFIRQWLTVNKRWSSPKALAGESYGGQRAAALARTLSEFYAINLNWMVLLSPAFSMDLGSPQYTLVTPMSLLPSYAAIAAHHGKSTVRNTPEGFREAEEFALNGYVTGLANLGRMSDAEQAAFFTKVGGMIGIDPDVVAKARGRVPAELFATQLLGSQNLVIDTYDGSLTTENPKPEKAEMVVFDRTISVLSGLFLAPFMDYVQGDLGYITTRPYIPLSLEVNMAWDRSAKVGGPEDLAIALGQNHDLKVIVLSGYYDLNANYLLARYLLEQTVRGKTTRDRLFFANYLGGHMFYLRPQSRSAMTQDVRNLFLGRTQSLTSLTGPG